MENNGDLKAYSTLMGSNKHGAVVNIFGFHKNQGIS
jgi:hypothetical protein